MTVFLLISCDLKETIGKVQDTNTDLQDTFGHPETYSSISFGTEEEDDYLTITFCNYKIYTKSYKELEDLASKVTERVLEQDPDFKNLDYIEVRFTNEKDTDDMEDFVVFKHNNKESE